MEKIDIAEQMLYIKSVRNAIASNMKRSKAWIIDGRHSDALIYVTHGECAYTFLQDGYRFTVHEGDVLYLARGAVYHMEILTERYSVIYCDFDFDTDGSGKSRVYRLNSPDTESLFKHMLRIGSTSPASCAETLAVLYQIYSEILRTAESEYLSPIVRDRIADTKAYVDAHFGDANMTVASLVAHAQISEAYLRRLFKAQYGVAPAKYITHTRLSYAKQLLTYPFLSLDEIASQCGFLGASYFCRVFKKETGITPTQYRKKRNSTNMPSKYEKENQL